MTYALLPLPYAVDALAPQMSAETLEFHHGKHHQGYIDKVNELAAQTSMGGRGLVELIGTAGPGALFNNACQVWNHNFFWLCLSPTTAPPGGELAELIAAGFGSVEALLKQFSDQAVAHFGSGWAWLVLEQGAIKVTTYHDGDTPAAHPGVIPLFTLDLWEHAYYIDYRNARPRYVDAVLGAHVNWDFVAQNLDGQGVARADQDWMP
ncbi:MAG: superoxide dismutase [Pseudomonadota bacterium]